MPATFWLLLILYPVWGLAQQFGLQALVTRNLGAVVNRRAWRVAGAAVLFSLAHFPTWELMILVFPAGVVFTWIFDKYRNLWAIGLAHGLLGASAYYFVLGKDPGMEILRLMGLG
jgi:membrane protease YdiL (CAAX protease family)